MDIMDSIAAAKQASCTAVCISLAQLAAFTPAGATPFAHALNIIAAALLRAAGAAACSQAKADALLALPACCKAWGAAAVRPFLQPVRSY